MYWTIRPLVEKTNEMLEKMGTPNISPFNYVHEFCKDKSWLIKIAGHINRKYNISHLAQALKFGGSFWGKEGYDYQYVLSPEDYTLMRESLDDSHFDKVIEKNKEIVIENAPKTYQHISRMAAYLLFLEAHKKNNFSKVKMPEMYLVHVPGRPKEVSDRNYIMLEKKLVSLEDLKDVTQEEEQQLQNAIKATGIFSINTDNCKRDTTDNTIVILDTEQPNNSLPTEFFHQNEKVIQGNIGGALFELNKMIQKIREQGSEIQENK